MTPKRVIFKWIVLIEVIVMITLSGCYHNKKKITTDFNPIEGIFSGTFCYNGADLNMILYIQDSTFEAILYNAKLPEICHGTYVQKSKTLFFNNLCKRKSGLNWKIILSGLFEYNYEGAKLNFWNDRFSFKLKKEKEKIFYKG